MPEGLDNAADLRAVNDRLCAEAVRLHKAISDMPPRYGDTARLGLTHELMGIRTALCLVHGGAPDPVVPSSHPAVAVLIEWWRCALPDDWAGEDAVRARYAEQLYIALHELFLASEHRSAAALARAVGMGHSTVYYALGNPARSRWCTLELIVKTLGGHWDELRELWVMSQTIPAVAANLDGYVNMDEVATWLGKSRASVRKYREKPTSPRPDVYVRGTPRWLTTRKSDWLRWFNTYGPGASPKGDVQKTIT